MNQVQKLYEYATHFKGQYCFFLVVLPGNKKTSELYPLFKSKLELELGVTTQFVLEGTVQNAKPSAVDNIVAAINRKCNLAKENINQPSENWRVEKLPLISQMKIGFIGIDIHHPPAASHDRPSEAAISISCNPGVTSYYSTFRYKEPKELVTKPYL